MAMPLYEYLCSNCQARFEVLRTLGQADDPASCPHCHSSETRRLISIFALGKGEGGVTQFIGGRACSCADTSCTAGSLVRRRKEKESGG